MSCPWQIFIISQMKMGQTAGNGFDIVLVKCKPWRWHIFLNSRTRTVIQSLLSVSSHHKCLHVINILYLGTPRKIFCIVYKITGINLCLQISQIILEWLSLSPILPAAGSVFSQTHFLFYVHAKIFQSNFVINFVDNSDPNYQSALLLLGSHLNVWIFLSFNLLA